MTIPTLCPACLTELADDYPYDHVAIDLALAGEPHLFHSMTRAERAETITTGLRRGIPLSHLSIHFRTAFTTLRDLVPDDLKPRSKVDQRSELEQQIRDLWAENLDDSTISLRLNRTIGTVSRIRWRLKLPAKYGPGGRPREQVAA